LHKIGEKVRSREESCTKYTLNKCFFDEIDTEEKAYWLGFITADGGIVCTELVLSLKTEDTNHIELFQKSIQSNHPIKISKTKINDKIILQPRLVISSVDLIHSLKKLGVGEKKSLIVQPAMIPEQFYKDYWRGIFDGDGHIGLSSTHRCMELTGNYFILDGFSKFIETEIGIKGKISKSKNVYRVRYGKRSSILEICRLLYSQSNISLKRKYIIAEKIFSDNSFFLRKNSKLRIKQSYVEAKDNSSHPSINPIDSF
jgi:hypothetical protein